MLAYESRLSSVLRGYRCIRCQTQAPWNAVRNKSTTPSSQPPANNNKQDDVQPVELDRPIGMPYPPLAGQNTGIDSRSLRERRDDFVDYQKHLQRRKELTRQVAKPYFREWSNLRYNEGKTFKSNPRIFKQEKSLFFPNLYGITLASPSKPKDTTDVLKGKISVVNLFSSLWAEQQVATFTSAKQNPELHKILAAEPSIAQWVDINLEENRMRAWLVKLFMGSLRRKLPVEQHERYFLVQKGMTETIKLSIGMLNSKVGYVYLVDEFGHIRWAGSGPAEPGEKESLNAGLARLIDERKRRSSGEDKPAPSKPRVVSTPRLA